MNIIITILLFCFGFLSVKGQGQNMEKKKIPHLKFPHEAVENSSTQIKSAAVFIDLDNDGVRDEFDRELNSPEGFPVDVFGVSVDSDKDGCLDADDPEPNSSQLIPIEYCVNIYVSTIPGSCNGIINAGSKTEWCIPSLHFEKDSVVIVEESVIYLRSVFELMDRYPQLKMAIIGNSTLYSDEVITLERIKFVTQYLLDKGISEERLIIKQNKYKVNNSTTDLLDSNVAFNVIQ